jgi:hypothetical protein
MKMKQKPVYICSAPMGSGKTQAFIDNLDGHKNYLLAVPKIDLADSIVGRIKTGTDIDVEAIHSADWNYGSVGDRAETALTEGREGSVVIITQQTLLNINAEYLSDWIVVLDEVPNINNCASIQVGYGIFEDLFSQYIEIDDDLKCTIDGLRLLDVQQRYSEA